MNVIELTSLLSILCGMLAGLITGKHCAGIGGLVFGAILGFAIGLGFVLLLHGVDRSISSMRLKTPNLTAVVQIGLAFALLWIGPILAALSSIAATLLITRLF